MKWRWRGAVVIFSVLASVLTLGGCGEGEVRPPENSDSEVCDAFSAVVPRNTRIETKEELEALHASGCSEVTQSLRVFYIPGVTELRLLENIRRVGGTIEIGYARDLQALDGLEGVVEYERLSLIQNDELTDTSALPTPPESTRPSAPPGSRLQGLLLHHNDRLQNFEGLEGIKHVESRFEIVGNRNLSRLSALESLETYGKYADSKFVVRDNPSLPQCEVRRFWDGLEVEYRDSIEVVIEGNDTEAVCP